MLERFFVVLVRIQDVRHHAVSFGKERLRVAVRGNRDGFSCEGKLFARGSGSGLTAVKMGLPDGVPGFLEKSGDMFFAETGYIGSQLVFIFLEQITYRRHVSII